MKTKDLILITTHLTPEDLVGAKGAAIGSRIREVFAQAQTCGLNTIVVLGTTGDDLLRSFPELENCDLTFDPNFKGEIFSSIQSGLAAVSGAAFVLPIDQAPLDIQEWRVLDQKMWNTPPGQIDVFQTLKCEGGDRVPAYPQLVTLTGVKRLQKLPVDIQWLHDPRLQIQS